MDDKEFLEGYRASDFELLSVAVDAAIFGVEVEASEDPVRMLDTPRLKMLLVKRTEPPFKGRWSLPGGFLGPGESLDEAVRRVILKKTGLADLYLEQLYTFGDPGRDPRCRVVSCAYMALLERTPLPPRDPSAGEAAWFSVALDEGKALLALGSPAEALEVPLAAETRPAGRIDRKTLRASGPSPMAFDHADVALAAVSRLRSKIVWTDLAFTLMPEKFTLSHLMAVYEAILGAKLLAPAFRKKMAGRIEPTGELAAPRKFRPAMMYRYRGGTHRDHF
jgi:ADP-ribose pyrophosphatase YjhB (NUDIX family)